MILTHIKSFTSTILYDRRV